MMYRVALLVLLCGCFALFVPGQAQKPTPAINHIEHFAKVSDHYYRGGQPDKDSLKLLAGTGIHTIVDLRGEDKDRNDSERETAKSLGMQYISLPLSALHAPSDQQVTQFLSTIHNTANQPVYVHCRRGSDRTGTMMAILRIQDFGWTADQAYDEMKKYGFRPFLYPTMKQYVYKYAEKKVSH